jgi:clan AA aspartic protease (TIGR02281 family)
MRIPFERQGKLMWVEAMVNGRHRVPFLIDTGASGVSLPESVAERIGIQIRPDTRRVTVSTAAGTIRVPLVKIDSIALGPAEVRGLEATVNPSMEVGLLGGAFFNNFRYEVDMASGIITLEPNEGVRAGEAAEQWQQRFRQLKGSIARLEAHLASREVTRPNQRAELEQNLAVLRRELHDLEIEANHARVPHHWRR